MGSAKLLKQYPLMFYFCLAYGISWLLWLPLVAAAAGWIRPVSCTWHLVGSLGPALAAFIFARLLEGRTAIRQLYNGMVK